jgi:hypothetical protein
VSRPRSSVFASALIGLMTLLACGGTSAPSSPTAGAGATVAVPTVAGPSLSIAAPETPGATVPVAETLPPATIPPTSPPETALPTLPTIGPIPSFSFTPDVDLEALFPRKIAGADVRTFSLHLKDIKATFESDPKTKQVFEDFLAALGKTIDDVSMASGAYGLKSGFEQIIAVRVAGADPNILFQGALSVAQAGKDVPGDWKQASGTVGGKSVATLTDTTDPQADVDYYYSYGDVVFFVTTGDPKIAATLLSPLP